MDDFCPSRFAAAVIIIGSLYFRCLRLFFLSSSTGCTCLIDSWGESNSSFSPSRKVSTNWFRPTYCVRLTSGNWNCLLAVFARSTRLIGKPILASRYDCLFIIISSVFWFFFSLSRFRYSTALPKHQLYSGSGKLSNRTAKNYGPGYCSSSLALLGSLYKDSKRFKVWSILLASSPGNAYFNGPIYVQVQLGRPVLASLLFTWSTLLAKTCPRRTHALIGWTYHPTRPTKRCMRSWRRPLKKRAALPSSDFESALLLLIFFFCCCLFENPSSLRNSVMGL